MGEVDFETVDFGAEVVPDFGLFGLAEDAE